MTPKDKIELSPDELDLEKLITGKVKEDEKPDALELTILVLQEALLKKQPFCPFARLGGAEGMRMTRAAFGLMLKFSENIQRFAEFIL